MTRTPMSEDDVADLSDDEIMAMSSAPLMAEAEAAEDVVSETDADEDTGTDGTEAQESTAEVAAEAGSADDDDEPVVDDQDDTDDLDDDAFEKATPAEAPGSKSEKPAPAAKKVEAPAEAKAPDAGQAPVDYKTAYETLMAPFKANGKEVQLQTPEDAVRLMQMGANYTKKLQGLAPGLRILKMLEKNGLMDEGKINRLIDLEKKDPAAIKQMIKDSGVDPMDIDISEDTGYKPGNYQVSDEEMRFTSMVEEVASDPVGKDFIGLIHRTWDKKSKDALWQDPEILRILTQQRKNGILDQISAEVDRRKTLGYISQDTPFLTAYENVGKDLDKQGLLQAKNADQPATKVGAEGQPVIAAPGRKVLDQRTGLKKPGPTVANSDKARAASPAKGVPAKKGAVDFNPLSLSDEDFEKHAAMARRL